MIGQKANIITFFLTLLALCFSPAWSDDKPEWPSDTEKEIYRAVIEATSPCLGKQFVVFDRARTGNIEQFWAHKMAQIPRKYDSLVRPVLDNTTVSKDLSFLSSLGYETVDQDATVRARRQKGKSGPVQHVWLSPIGMDVKHKMAALFRGYACGDKKGFGVVILELIKDKWSIIDEIPFRDE